MNRFILGLAVLTLLVNGLGKANADVIFNDYGPLYTYQTTIGWTVSGSSTTFPFTAANEFTASLTAAVTAVDLGISLAAGTNSVVVELMTDNGGTPGSVLESYGFVDQMGAFGSQNSPLVAHSVTNPILVAGTNYWMVAVPGASDTNAAWNYNDQSVTGTDLYSRDGGAFRLGRPHPIGGQGRLRVRLLRAGILCRQPHRHPALSNCSGSGP